MGTEHIPKEKLRHAGSAAGTEHSNDKRNAFEFATKPYEAADTRCNPAIQPNFTERTGVV
jgi:hypothetical protein